MADNEESKDSTLHHEISDAFQEHYTSLLQVANRVLENRAAAEDVLGTVFLRLAKAPPKEFVNNPPGYLHHAVLNEALAVRRSGNRRVELDRAFKDQQTPPPAITSRGRDDMLRRLMDAKSQLELGDVALLTLRYEMDLSCKEIAERLGRTRMGIVMSLARARARIRKLMDESAAETRTLTELKPNAGETQ
jgi:RNA polymerase sigma factor (sigma-70 family)